MAVAALDLRAGGVGVGADVGVNVDVGVDVDVSVVAVAAAVGLRNDMLSRSSSTGFSTAARQAHRTAQSHQQNITYKRIDTVLLLQIRQNQKANKSTETKAAVKCLRLPLP